MKVVLASGNPGKLKEFQLILRECGFEIIPQSEFSVPEVPETGTTFVENAIIKARHASKISGLPAIADDSGIEVDALKGAPGVYSARFAGADANDRMNNEKLISLMQNQENRSARYQCVLVYMTHSEDSTPLIAQGSWEGEIRTQPKGKNGFGYDPYFFVPSHHCHAAELEKDVKNSISHRAKAMQHLLKMIRDAK